MNRDELEFECQKKAIERFNILTHCGHNDGEDMSLPMDSLEIHLKEFANAIIDLVQQNTNEWVSVEDELPEDCRHVEITQTARYKIYKGNSQQYKKGLRGRWQVFNGYGWDNIDWIPSKWLPTEQPREQ